MASRAKKSAAVTTGGDQRIANGRLVTRRIVNPGGEEYMVMVIYKFTADTCQLRDVDTSHPEIHTVPWQDIYLQEQLPYPGADSPKDPVLSLADLHWYDSSQPLNSWSSVYYPAELLKKPPKALSSTRTVTLAGDATPRIVPTQVSMFGHTFPGCIARVPAFGHVALTTALRSQTATPPSAPANPAQARAPASSSSSSSTAAARAPPPAQPSRAPPPTAPTPPPPIATAATRASATTPATTNRGPTSQQSQPPTQSATPAAATAQQRRPATTTNITESKQSPSPMISAASASPSVRAPTPQPVAGAQTTSAPASNAATTTATAATATGKRRREDDTTAPTTQVKRVTLKLKEEAPATTATVTTPIASPRAVATPTPIPTPVPPQQQPQLVQSQLPPPPQPPPQQQSLGRAASPAALEQLMERISIHPVDVRLPTIRASIDADSVAFTPLNDDDRVMPEAPPSFATSLIHLAPTSTMRTLSTIEPSPSATNSNTSMVADPPPLVGYKSALGCLHRWDQIKHIKSKQMIVAPYVVNLF